MTGARSPRAEASNMPDQSPFRPGFRLSEVDVGVLIVGVVGSLLLARVHEPLGIAAMLSVLHFFLFCNVLRMNRTFELIWAATFVLLSACTMLTGIPTWLQTYMVTLTVTAVLSLIQVLMPSYHGVLWAVVNPNLPRWWEANTRAKPAARTVHLSR